MDIDDGDDDDDEDDDDGCRRCRYVGTDYRWSRLNNSSSCSSSLLVDDSPE